MSKKILTTENCNVIFHVDILNKKNYRDFGIIFIITGFTKQGFPKILSYTGKDRDMTIVAFSNKNIALEFIKYQSQIYKNFAISEAGVKAVPVKLDLHFSEAPDKEIVLDPPKEIDIKYTPSF